jgi:oxygen-independent coproporphyrinogen-3 oxidase
VYCDFAIAVRSRVPVDEYIDAASRELGRHAATLGPLETVYFGGGTPSRLGADGISRLLDGVRSQAEIDAEAEVTIEANPEDVSVTAARAWAAAGVNRVSLGVQSFDNAVLSWMHRTHDASAAHQAVQALHEAGVSNVSIDLIFAVPRFLERSWHRDLDQALALDVPHVSVYGLTIEPRTPLGRWVARDDVSEAPEDDFAAEFLLAHAALTSAGFEHYEVSNYGTPGQHSRHNWAYWRRRPYVGLGPSAHGFDGSQRSWNVDAYAHWLRALQTNDEPRAGAEQLEERDVSAEKVYLGLRTTDGVPMGGDEGRFVQPWIEQGWARLDAKSILRLTEDGWLRLDSLAAALTDLRSRS